MNMMVASSDLQMEIIARQQRFHAKIAAVAIKALEAPIPIAAPVYIALKRQLKLWNRPLVTVEAELAELPAKPRRPSIEEVKRQVIIAFKMSRAEFESKRRVHRCVRPRQAAMYLANELTGKTDPMIGRSFGGYDHTTVLHAKRAVPGFMANDPEFREKVEAARAALTYAETPA